MPAFGIIEDLDVIKDIGSGLRARAVYLPGYALRFERGEEAFHGRVIPHLASAAHAAGDSVFNLTCPALRDLCRKHGFSDASYYKWKAKYGDMDVSDAKRLKTLEDENSRLKRLMADAMLDNAALKDIVSRKW